MGVGECGQVWAGVRGCVHVCGMDFQNFYRRIESLHQRTLTCILYEFFDNHSMAALSAYSFGRAS